jgi:hypothetical protein
MHLEYAVRSRVSSRLSEVVCFGMPCRALSRVGMVGRKGAAAGVRNNTIPALMAASCGRSVMQFVMAFSQCDQDDGKWSFQDVNVSDGNMLMVLTAVSIKRAGTINRVSSCALYNLLGAFDGYSSQQDTPGFLFLQTLSVCIAHGRVFHIFTSSDCKDLTYARRFTADMYSVCSNGLLLSGLRYASKVQG